MKALILVVALFTIANALTVDDFNQRCPNLKAVANVTGLPSCYQQILNPNPVSLVF